MTCLDEAGLLRVHYGDASDAEQTHAAACAACARALAALASDLGRIDAVMRTGVTVRRTARPVLVRLVPIAAAAILVLALLFGRLSTTPIAGDDTLAMLDELTATVAAYGDTDLLLAAEDGATGRSTCTWGEPFLEMGCDEPPVTLVAWR